MGLETRFPAFDGLRALEQARAGGEERRSNLLKWRKVPSPTPGQVACIPLEAPHQIHWHTRLCLCVLTEKVVLIHPNKPEGDYVEQPSGITEEIWELQQGTGAGKNAGRERQYTCELHSLLAPYLCPSGTASLGQLGASLDIPAESSPSG